MRWLFARDANTFTSHQFVVWLLTNAAAVIPWFFLPNTPDAFEANKLTLLTLIVTVAFTVWGSRALLHREEKITWSFPLTALAIFGLVTFASAMFSLSRQRSFVGMEGLSAQSVLAVLAFAVFLFLASQSLRQFADVFKVIAGFVVGIVVGSVITTVHAWGGSLFPWAGTQVPSFNPFALSTLTPTIFFAILTLVSLVCCCIFTRWRLLSGFGVIMGLFALASFSSVAGWISLGVGLFTIVGALAFHGKRLPSWWIIIPTVTLAVAVLLMVFPTPLERTALPDDTMLPQKSGWDIARATLTEKPLVGTGPQTFLDAFQRFRQESFNETVVWQYRFIRSSSMWLDVATTTGILGVLALAFFVASILWHWFREVVSSKDSPERRMVTMASGASLVLITTSGFFLSWNTALWFAFWVLCAITLALSQSRQAPASNRPPVSWIMTARASAIVLVFVALVLSSFLFARNWNADRLRASAAEHAARGESAPTVRETLERARRWNDSVEVRLALAQAFAAESLTSIEPGATALPEDAANNIKASLTEANRALEMDPTNAAVYESVAGLFEELSLVLSDADAYIVGLYERALEHDAKNPILHANLSQAYFVRAGRATTDQDRAAFLDKARSSSSRALELKPEFIDPALTLALTDEVGGDLSNADQRFMELQRRYPRTVQITLAYANFLERHDQADRALQNFELAVQQAPGFTPAHWQLGLAYEKRERWQEALEAFETVKRLTPETSGVEEKIETIRQRLTAGQS